MNKKLRKTLFLWGIIAVAAAGTTFLIAEHLGAGMGTHPAVTMTPSADVQQDESADDAADGAAVAPVALQEFSNDGYTFSVPASWDIERTGTDTIAVHPDAASPDASCKIEVSAFPYSAGMDMADWIAHRIGADPSLSVNEISSGDVPLAGGTGVQWTGTIDGAPTTLVYAFGADHAYEIAPSVIGNNAGDATSCGDMLQTLLSAFTL